VLQWQQSLMRSWQCMCSVHCPSSPVHGQHQLEAAVLHQFVSIILISLHCIEHMWVCAQVIVTAATGRNVRGGQKQRLVMNMYITIQSRMLTLNPFTLQALVLLGSMWEAGGER